jgi:hypothetical protein
MTGSVALKIVETQYAPATSALSRQALEASIDAACRKVAPSWPLKNFVAVNPFLGFADRPFAETSAILRRVARIDMLAPRAFYQEAVATGVIDDASLEAALATAPRNTTLPIDLPALKAKLKETPSAHRRPPGVFTTVAELLDELADGDRQASLVGFMIDEISKWCAAYFDEGQANWRLPVRHLSPYDAWRATARFDRNPEVMGVKGFRKTIESLPEDPIAAIGCVIDKLGVPARAVSDYLYRALFDIGGWAAYARHLVWNSELHGEKNDTLLHLLAIRISYGYGLYQARTDARFRAAWSKAMAEAALTPLDERLNDDEDLALDLLLHEAYEIAHRRGLIARLANHVARAPRNGSKPRPAVQAAFCIDVRSEVFRRAFETILPDVATVGFAGFFGFPIEYVPIAQKRGGAQCPVLLKPSFIVCEAVNGASETEEKSVLDLRLLRRRVAKALKAFKLSAVSSFAYVETVGLTYVAKIVTDSFGLTRPAPHPNLDGLDRSMLARVGPRLAPRVVGGRATGFDPEQRLAMAEAVLKAMSMREGFARLVLLAGHGSTTVNNPHASGLDCGACGGHTGEANARVAAAILNDGEVRRGLREKGIVIADDVWFLGALHDTTTDEVKIFDAEEAPCSHRQEIDELKGWLAQAGRLARLERASLLGVTSGSRTSEQVLARSRDWSQVRPEWGLAGNAAFVAAPRERTAGLDLAGRAFLHSYDYHVDEGFRVLELIMTAPMVVASWINLQYFGSTTNNKAFGSGNKTLHNVVGRLGVIEGNAGDLRVGLPWQSVHDGKRFVHEPLRLNVFIAAPESAMDRVLENHAHVRSLVDNGWLHLFSLGDETQGIRRRCGPADWREEAAIFDAAAA